MLDKPAGEELLGAVIVFLRDEVMPALDGARSFRMRVAANALDLVRREMAGGAAAEAAELGRLSALLGHAGTLDSLNSELCEAICNGSAHLGTPGLLEHVWASLLDKLAIEQPGYAGFKRLQARNGTADEGVQP